MSCEQPVSDAGRGDSPAASPPPNYPKGHLASGRLVGVTFAVIGGLAAWGLVYTFHPVFVIPSELADIDMPNSRQSAEIRAAELKAGLSNAILVVGWIGALLAGAMAAGEAWARRSWKMALAGVVGCALVGALLGSAAGWIGHVVYHVLLIPFEGTTSLQGTVVVQMVMLAVLGGGVGLVLGSLAGFTRSTWTRVLAGALAGIFAGMVYPVATAYLVPAAHTDYVIPRTANGALPWLIIIAVFLGIIIPGMQLRRASD